MSNANGPDFVESTRAANDRKPTSTTTIYTKKETTASFLQSSLFDFLGGDEENRTPDPLLARQMLSQLSYTPILLHRFVEQHS